MLHIMARGSLLHTTQQIVGPMMPRPAAMLRGRGRNWQWGNAGIRGLLGVMRVHINLKLRLNFVNAPDFLPCYPVCVQGI